MKKRISICLISLLSAIITLAQDKNEPKDVQSIQNILVALYDVISGEAGEERNWERMKNLFKSNARLNAVGKNRQGEIAFVSMTLDEYIERNAHFFKNKGFFESEISKKVDRFGNIAQVFSTYEARFEKEGRVFMRGINSIQLAYEGGRWWIINVLWNAESEEYPIPENYLKN